MDYKSVLFYQNEFSSYFKFYKRISFLKKIPKSFNGFSSKKEINISESDNTKLQYSNHFGIVDIKSFINYNFIIYNFENFSIIYSKVINKSSNSFLEYIFVFGDQTQRNKFKYFKSCFRSISLTDDNLEYINKFNILNFCTGFLNYIFINNIEFHGIFNNINYHNRIKNINNQYFNFKQKISQLKIINFSSPSAIFSKIIESFDSNNYLIYFIISLLLKINFNNISNFLCSLIKSYNSNELQNITNLMVLKKFIIFEFKSKKLMNNKLPKDLLANNEFINKFLLPYNFKVSLNNVNIGGKLEFNIKNLMLRELTKIPKSYMSFIHYKRILKKTIAEYILFIDKNVVNHLRRYDYINNNENYYFHTEDYFNDIQCINNIFSCKQYSIIPNYTYLMKDFSQEESVGLMISLIIKLYDYTSNLIKGLSIKV